MTAAYTCVAVATIVATAGIAVADFAKAPFVLKNAAAVGVPESWVYPLATAKAAGAAGLLLGLFGVPLVGTAAAIGLVLFFVGAVLTHLRAGDCSAQLLFPGGFLALATGTLVLGLLSH
ncbi:DoxX family protein [Pseudonocardia thermophila]|uniref:DoxX family protein n=1 Tax=Pseudonocardia thermophila TaxID=1848 RepID=UPI00248F3321|nr:DoxX family protein [Pseudonocardia thermophila]